LQATVARFFHVGLVDMIRSKVAGDAGEVVDIVLSYRLGEAGAVPDLDIEINHGSLSHKKGLLAHQGLVCSPMSLALLNQSALAFLSKALDCQIPCVHRGFEIWYCISNITSFDGSIASVAPLSNILATLRVRALSSDWQCCSKRGMGEGPVAAGIADFFAPSNSCS
jgi:hypothetical protein